MKFLRRPRVGEWVPAISQTEYTRTLEVGLLVGIQRKVWRIVDVKPLSPGNWSERAAEEWVKAGSPDPWERTPVMVLAVPVGGGKRGGITIEPWDYAPSWNVVPEHFAVCSQCGEPAPCAEYEGEVEAVYEMGKMAERMAVPDGWCPGCSQPISSRQKVHWFPGPNLLNLLAADGVAFHQRRECRWSAAEYEGRWVAADPTRERSLLTLKCEGTVVVHDDGSAECWGAADSDCPSIYAEHRCHTACYAQTHGCPRGCTKVGHPGIRLARNLTPGGALR